MSRKVTLEFGTQGLKESFLRELRHGTVVYVNGMPFHVEIVEGEPSQNIVKGNVGGPLVQAKDIHGGVHW
jgi:hypothetical protein